MAKFKVRLKITGLELEMEGSREDVPQLAESIQSQVSALMNPTGALIEGQTSPTTITPPDSQPTSSTKKKRRTKRSSTATNGEPGAQAKKSAQAAKDFVHDTDSWGTPMQSWSTAQKAMWLLYVIEKQAAVKELSDNEIAETFNKHFRQAGAISRGNVYSQLGKLKTQQPTPLGQNTVDKPNRWYLNASGSKLAEQLVAEARGLSGS